MTASAVEERDWSPLRSAALPDDYAHLRLGPLALGPPKWRSTVGQIHLALADAHDEVVMVDRMNTARARQRLDPSEILADIRPVLGLSHRHVMRVIGAGIDADVPYVVRHFCLGRPLSQVVDAGPIDDRLAVALAYPVAEALAFLASSGPQPGVCAIGGFDMRDVWVGFDGGVWMTGQGTYRVRGETVRDAIARDLAALRRMIKVLGLSSLSETLRPISDATEAQRALRKADREACGRRAELLGAWMRAIYGDVIHTERASFGLRTLH